MTFEEIRKDIKMWSQEWQEYRLLEFSFEIILLDNLSNINEDDYKIYSLHDLLSPDIIEYFLSSASLYLTAELLGGRITQIQSSERGPINVDLSKQHLNTYKSIVDKWRSVGWVRVVEAEKEVKVITY